MKNALNAMTVFLSGWIDQGSHIFRLALYPHLGSIEEAEVIAKTHGFNCPSMAFTLPQNQVENGSLFEIFPPNG